MPNRPPALARGYSYSGPYVDQRMHPQFPGAPPQAIYGSNSSIPSQPYHGPQDMQGHGTRDPQGGVFPPGMSFVTNESLEVDLRSLEASARKAFDNADRDKSGYLDFKEFLDSLRNLDVNIPYHFAMARFAKLDKDKDGRIRESEFVNGYLEDRFQQKSQSQQQSQAPFQQQGPQFPQHPQHQGAPQFQQHTQHQQYNP